MSIQSILSSSLNLSRMQTMQSVQVRTQGNINVLKSEIKQDGGNPEKQKKVEDLEKRSTTLMENLKDLTDINGTTKPSNEKDKDTEASETEPNTDKADLSHRAETGEESKGNKLHHSPISYDAQGNTAVTASQPSGQTVDTVA